MIFQKVSCIILLCIEMVQKKGTEYYYVSKEYKTNVLW